VGTAGAAGAAGAAGTAGAAEGVAEGAAGAAPAASPGEARRTRPCSRRARASAFDSFAATNTSFADLGRLGGGGPP